MLKSRDPVQSKHFPLVTFLKKSRKESHIYLAALDGLSLFPFERR